MRCFRTIIGIAIVVVQNGRHYFFPRRTVGTEFVSDHSSRRLASVLQHFAEKPVSITGG